MAGKRSKVDEEAAGVSDGDAGSPPPAKKTKTATGDKKRKGKDGGEGASNAPVPTGVQTNDEGESYVHLSAKRRATVREFKGILMVDLREYYTKDGETKPGAKGIGLTLEQWTALKEHMSEIDELLLEKSRSI